MARKRFMRGGRSVRETLWLGIPEIRIVNVSANAATFVAALSAGALALRPFTIVRSLIHWGVRSDQTGASENFASALGVCVVSDQSAAIGVTAIPTPFTDIGLDLWLLHAMITGRFEFVSGVGFEANSLEQKTVESRAMRKVEDGQDVAIVLENDATSTGTTNWTAGRMLVKLF